MPSMSLFDGRYKLPKLAIPPPDVVTYKGRVLKNRSFRYAYRSGWVFAVKGLSRRRCPYQKEIRKRPNGQFGTWRCSLRLHWLRGYDDGLSQMASLREGSGRVPA